MINFLKKCFRKSPFYNLFLNYRARKAVSGKTKLNIVETFPGFAANGAGSYKLRSKLTI